MKVLSNPITVKELRSRMRGLRSILPMMAYLVVLGIWVLIQFAEYGNTLSYIDLNEKGRFLGFMMLYGQLILVLILAPAYASSAITVEKERETFEVMLTTLLTSWEIVAGKVFSGFSYATLILISSLPLLALAFWMGGFEFDHLIWGFVIITSCALLTTCLGIMLSTLFGKSYMSTGVTYGLTIGGMGFSWAFYYLVLGLNSLSPVGASLFSWHTIPLFFLYALNPISMMMSLDQNGTGISATSQVPNPIISFLETGLSYYHLPYLSVYVVLSLALSAFMLYLSSIFLFLSSRKDT